MKLNPGYRTLVHVFTILALLFAFVPAVAAEAPVESEAIVTAEAPVWCLAGSINGWSESGYPLYDDGTNGDLLAEDGIFSLDFTVAATGRYEWKIKDCTTWDTAYPGSNGWLFTTQTDQTIKFTLDTNNHAADAGWALLPAQNIANAWGDDYPTTFTAVGSFQGWNNSDPATLMTDTGNGIYTLNYTVPTAGSYIGKVVLTGSWDAYGADGRGNNASNLDFTTASDNEVVVFVLDTRSGRVMAVPQGTATGNWCLAGSINGWSADGYPLFDDGTHGDLLGGDGIFTLDHTVADAGSYEWKIKDCSTWDVSYPNSNAWLTTTAAAEVVKFTLDTNDHSADAGWEMLPAQNIANAQDDLPASFNAVGSFQGWNNADPTWTLDSIGEGYFVKTFAMNAGSYIGKIAKTGTWNAYGAGGRGTDASNLTIEVAQTGDPVSFVLDTFTGRVMTYQPPKHGHGLDGLVELDGLYHDSRVTLYRNPGGAVELNTAVLLRLRTFHNDVEKARVRIYDTTAAGETLQDMTLAASGISCYDESLGSEETCDYWEYSLSAPAYPTTLYYRFVAKDGDGSGYYADDNMKDGGAGEATRTMVDNSYALTVYLPDFEVIDWAKNAVVYQIFPDRFNNGDITNDPTGTEPRYRYPDNPDDQIQSRVWQQMPEGFCRGYVDPQIPCTEGAMGRDYMGGDLEGVRQKLDYLQDLGVTVIYFNPIFDAGSNHLYDTQDYSKVDPFFGTEEDWDNLVTDAEAHGIRIILDGVFNHTSSDSPYFDRYGHYDEVGACESVDSPYRAWYTFHDVAAGTGVCAGTAGANSATYDSWWGFDSLPVLNKNEQGVKDLVYAGDDNITAQWINDGSSGWRLDVMGDTSFPAGFWEEFRATVKEADPDAIIIGELWKKGDMLPMIQGNIADTGMNYRFRNAIQGFFGTIDGKGFPDDGQSNQPPSVFANKMLSVREDYPDATYYTLMNLMDSHDTERILWSLTPGEANRDEREFNAANYAVGKHMLELAVVVQMTTPGAPTIYYGDEVGVTGGDDPDDRRTFPWAMSNLYLPLLANGNQQAGRTLTGICAADDYYGSLGDHALLDFYRDMTALRQANPVLRDGELSFLVTDDTNRTMAYMMRTADDAAVVAINRSDVAKTMTIVLGEGLPTTLTMTDALGTIAGDIVASGDVLTFELPALSAAVLMPADGMDLTAPAAPLNLTAAAGDGSVDLDWDASAGVDHYEVYRADLSGGYMTYLASPTDPAYTDTSVENGQAYYYVVTAKDAVGNQSARSNEVEAIPYLPFDWFGLQWPPSIDHVLSVNPTPDIYGQIFIDGYTNTGLLDPNSVMAQVGFGTTSSDPAGWTTWTGMVYNSQSGSNYEYKGTLRPEAVGVYDYVVRFSTDMGNHWFYGLIGGVPGVLTVTPNADVTPPDAPQNLVVSDFSTDFIELSWDAVADAAEYWIYRRLNLPGETYLMPYAKIAATATTFTDDYVSVNNEYAYVVKAVDAALNLSADSNEVIQTAEPKMVDVTFRVLVPDETPAADTVYIAGGTLPLEWNPGKEAMTKVGENLWEVTLSFPDGLTLQYKYVRGSWERVEWWGTITSTDNRSVVISYGTDGTQLVDNTATNWGDGADSEKAVQFWRDPLVTATVPDDGFSGEAPVNVALTFARTVQAPTAGWDGSVVVELGGVPVTGSIAQTDDTHVVWTPDAVLASGTYTVTVSGIRSSIGSDSVALQTPYVFTFTVNP